MCSRIFPVQSILILIQQQACDWLGKREAELSFAEAETEKRVGKWRRNRTIQILGGFK